MEEKHLQRKKRVDALMRRAGPTFGDIEVAYQLSVRHGRSVSQFSLRQWRVRGIPEDFWPDLAEMAGVGLEEVMRASG